MKIVSIPESKDSSIRQVTTVFGTLFNNLKIKLYDESGTQTGEEPVPLAFAAKEAYYTWLMEKTNKTDVEIGRKFPRLTYELTNISPDQTRQVNPIKKRSYSVGNNFREIRPTAYKFNYRLSLWAKDMDSSIQVIDQIVPYFRPEVSVKIVEHPDLYIYNDVKVVLTTINRSDNYTSGYSENRLIEWDFDFDVFANIIPRKYNSGKVIEDIIIDIFESGENV